VNAFDANHYRIGYGGGFFDRTLATLNPRPQSVGVGFDFQKVKSVRPEAHDQPLDLMITESSLSRLR
jgi:5,10-methenyltetrahydrofolate synthetase